jgi:hypothetical protein
VIELPCVRFLAVGMAAGMCAHVHTGMTRGAVVPCNPWFSFVPTPAVEHVVCFSWMLPSAICFALCVS